MKLRAHNTAGPQSGGSAGLGHVYTVNDNANVQLYGTPDWMEDAACGATDIDMCKEFNGRNNHIKIRAQRVICYNCPVQSDCWKELREMNPKDIVGIWAGKSNADWKRYLNRKRLDSNANAA